MKKTTIFFYLLLILSIISYIIGFETGGFQFSDIRYHLYFQGWISLATLLLCFVLICAVLSIYNSTQLVCLKYIPPAIGIFAVSVLSTGFHNSYCKVCSDLGFCSAAHNYPNALSLFSICISLVIYLISQSRQHNLGNALRKLWYADVVGFAGIITVLFISLFYMELPEPTPYKIEKMNIQGVIFLAIFLFCMAAFLTFFLAYRRNHQLSLLGISAQFIVTGAVQLVGGYHITSCYWCKVGECSEFFSLGGIFILTAMYLLWYSYSPLLNDSARSGEQ